MLKWLNLVPFTSVPFYWRYPDIPVNAVKPDFIDNTPLEHGRIDTRKIWTTTELSHYLNFPHVGQAFVIERKSIDKKTGKLSEETAYGITSRTNDKADAKRILETNRGHWSI